MFRHDELEFCEKYFEGYVSPPLADPADDGYIEFEVSDVARIIVELVGAREVGEDLEENFVWNVVEFCHGSMFFRYCSVSGSIWGCGKWYRRRDRRGKVRLWNLEDVDLVMVVYKRKVLTESGHIYIGPKKPSPFVLQ